MSPWVPGAVRAFLLADVAFAAACESRCGTRLPDDMTKPFVQVRVSGNIVLTAGFAKSPLVQIEPWVPPGRVLDPEVEAWNLAELAGNLLDKARNVTYSGMTWSGRWVDGPIPRVDVTRGEASPLYGAPIRIELKTHTR